MNVYHQVFGYGTIVLEQGATLIVRFLDSNSIKELPRAEFQEVQQLTDSLEENKVGDIYKVIARVLSESIQSVHNMWGVFASTKIALLPHQLWVCKKVTERIPARWLVADDVGLGKTVEAGLILTPLIQRNIAKRILIICPASLVRQWNKRMREMFGIHLQEFNSQEANDLPTYWDGEYKCVVASLQTLRQKDEERLQRITQANAWDLVIVDEAHHLHYNQRSAPSLGYQLIERLEKAKKIKSMIFFTGTPHRGKNFGFLALLRLLRNDLFSEERALFEQIADISEVIIRNNKSTVTNLRGDRLFFKPIVRKLSFTYTESERMFYQTLTEFIQNGYTYASSVNDNGTRNAIGLLLTAIQKIASSSVAAIASTLRKRLEQLHIQQDRYDDVDEMLQHLREKQRESIEIGFTTEEGDIVSEYNTLEQQLVELQKTIKLSAQHEEVFIKQLLELADDVEFESRIKIILNTIENEYAGKSILFFTEYKATQALLVSEIVRNYGETSVVFINGDGKLDHVLLSKDSSTYGKKSWDRKEAVALFNQGKARFMVSTEAAGEGIDLQEACHIMFHVDVPWNPMRMHQRVGRINRFGQKHQVYVNIVHNPDTIESKIWSMLEDKLASIASTIAGAMDEPEDISDLVLGIARPDILEQCCRLNRGQSQGIEEWFNRESGLIEGEDIAQVVQAIIGNAARFDFQNMSSIIPRLDMHHLQEFVHLMVKKIHNSTVHKKSEYEWLISMPEVWREPEDSKKAQQYSFNRIPAESSASKPVNMNEKLLQKAIEEAKYYEDNFILHSSSDLGSLAVFKLYDRITDDSTLRKNVIVGVQYLNGTYIILKDWQVILELNKLYKLICEEVDDTNIIEQSSTSSNNYTSLLEAMKTFLEENISDIERSFRMPKFDPISLLMYQS